MALASGLLWLGAVVSLAATLTPGIAHAIGRLATASAVVGAAVLAVDNAIDGYGIKAIADAWATADATDQQALARTLEHGLLLLGGPFRLWIALWLGLPLLLVGMAVALDRRWPGWFAAMGAAAGTAALLAGVSGFLGRPLVPDTLLFTAVAGVQQAWALLLAAQLWRRPNATAAT